MKWSWNKLRLTNICCILCYHELAVVNTAVLDWKFIQRHNKLSLYFVGKTQIRRPTKNKWLLIKSDIRTLNINIAYTTFTRINKQASCTHFSLKLNTDMCCMNWVVQFKTEHIFYQAWQAGCTTSRPHKYKHEIKCNGPTTSTSISGVLLRAAKDWRNPAVASCVCFQYPVSRRTLTRPFRARSLSLASMSFQNLPWEKK